MKPGTIVLLALILLLPGSLWTGTGTLAAAGKSSTPQEVTSIRIKGNKALKSDEIRGIMTTSTRTSFIGTGIFRGGVRPFISEDFEKDINLIRKLYTFKGYFFAEVDTTVVRKPGRTVDILIQIRENNPTRLDSLSYAGLDNLTEEIRARYLKKSQLKLKDIFSVEKLIAERDRTLEFFRENGYSYFHPDSIRIKVDTLGLNAGVHFQLSLPEHFTYGPVKAVVHDPIKKDDAKTAVRFQRDNISVTIYGGQKFSRKLFSSSIAMKQGKLTQQSLEQQTLQNFGSTNLFSSISIEKDSIKAGSVYTTVHLEPSPKHQIEPKLVVDNRYGSLFLGGALAYENRNLFGGGQQLRLSTNYGTQTSANTNLLGNLKEGQYDKIIPYEFNIKANLLMPVLKKQGSFYNTSAEYSQARLPVLLSSRREIFRGTYSTKPSANTRLNFDFFEIEVVRKDSLRGFQQLFKTDLARNIGINPANPTAVKNGIDSLLQTRLNQTFRLQYNYSNRLDTSPLKKTTWNLTTTAEESGSLLWLIDKYVDKKQYTGFGDMDPQIFGTAYSQYFKLDTQLAFAREVMPDRQLAGRIALGWMSPYGRATTTPEEHRFYAGGSNSMRGWLFNTLGPANSSSKAISNFGADIKAELGLEYRMKLFKVFGQPSGVTFFTDVGNIWDRKGPYAFSLQSLTRDFAWDWGTGLRIGSPIGPFRFDFAWKVHDPANPSPWQFTNVGLSNLTFNFGIGEAF
ncbi:MAG: sorting and assembly machinery component 50 [Chlorobiaceae bacterium]|nr:sorting and assembly machinery component 50 [Chlorobiaceae bacterium]